MKTMKTIKASEFKAKCLSLMDDVAQSGEEIVVTKNGKPVSRLVPIKQRPKQVFGLHRGMWELRDDLVEPVNEPWDVEQR
ncbi:MAG: type II toxin-antitoxin system Phd/YefM family antitoxin [Pseudomonadales bacterium]